MILTSAQLTALRSKPQATKLYLSIYQPSTVLACRVNDGAIAKGERLITFDGTTAGSYLLVQSGMTLMVGSSAGGFDKGTVRVRSATSTVLTVAENSHINWADDDYLTVVNLYEINAVYPRIIQDPADDTNTLWYKDYDIAYTNQNSILGSFINMGCHYAGFSGNVFYSASGTYNLLSESLSYHWFFEGGTPTGSSVNTPGNIAYSTPGHYTTRLIVSGSSSGAVDTSYRHISIYDRPGEGQNTPTLKWELLDFSGSRDQGGYSVRIRLHETVPSSVLREGSLIIIFADDWYGDLATKQSIGGNALNRSTIVFVGYVLEGTIRYNYRASYVDFDLGSPTEIMKLSEGFSISVQDSLNPATATSDPNIPSSWITVLNMDTRRALYHYLRWHTTVLNCCDIEFLVDDRPLQYFDADRTSIYDALMTLVNGTLVGGVCSDRQGKIWLEHDINLQPSLFKTTFPLSNIDWMGDPILEEQRMEKMSYIEVGGVAYTGAGGTYTPLLSSAPGSAPGYRGAVQRLSGLSLDSQAELNTIAGVLLAKANAKYPDIGFNLTGNYRNFDIAPQEILPITIAYADTVRGIVFSNKSFYLNSLRFGYSSENEMLLPSINVTELVTGVDGDTMTIPSIPPSEGFDQPAFEFPVITFPPFPTVVIGGGDVYPNYVPTTHTIVPSAADEVTSQTGRSWLSPTTSVYVAVSDTLYIPIGTTYTQVRAIPVFQGQGGDSGNIFAYNYCDVEGVDEYDSDGSVTSTIKAVTVQEPDNLLFSYDTDFGINVSVKEHNVLCFRFGRYAADGSDTYGSWIIFAGWILEWS